MNKEELNNLIKTPKTSPEEKIIYQVIAAGLNNLGSAPVFDSEQKIIDSFLNQSFEIIFSCWPYLEQDVQFYIFKSFSDEFREYLRKNKKDTLDKIKNKK